jgi:predicted glycosyltransferase
MNDNEHAVGNIPAFICASRIMVPEFLDLKKLKKQGAHPKKVVHYPGVKEGIYLWELDARLSKKGGRSKEVKSRKVVYVRPEPWTAQYYKGSINFLDDLLLRMQSDVDIVLLPRDREQGSHYRESKFSKIQVITTALDIADIAPDCDLFIGAGGTMTREMAVLGIPTISVYQDKLLDVDRYLLKVGAFEHKPRLTAREAMQYLDSAQHRPPNRELLEKGRAAYDVIKNEVLNG